MTLIHESDTRGPLGGGTHVLLIGVGWYRYLKDGDKEKGQAERLSYLGQIDSPPVSAHALANWIIRTPLTPPRHPLASVELLVSSRDPSHQPFVMADGTSKQIAAATWDGIAAAWTRWRHRCDEHEDNVALFYFCGHGLSQGTSSYLLPEDFGNPDYTPWDHAIDFGKSWVNLNMYNKAARQYAFVDTCLHAEREAIANPRELSHGSSSPGARSALALHATVPNASAHAPSGAVRSCFASALLEALQGNEAENLSKRGRWRVSLERLSETINRRLRTYRTPCTSQRTYSSGAFILEGESLHELSTLPARVTVRCQPRRAMAQATLFLTRQPGGADYLTREPEFSVELNEWVVAVPAGIYQIGARFKPGSGFMNMISTPQVLRAGNPREVDLEVEVADEQP